MTLVLSDVRKKLGTFEMPPLELTVPAGKYFVLLGPSGVGKTVLLEIIAGLIKPDSGNIAWDGRDVTHAPPEQRSFAMVYQDYALFPHMTVSGNIAYGLLTKGESKSVISQKVAEAAELVSVTSLLDRHPGTLSGGEQQRVALARALVVEPDVLLLDEPLSAVDMRMRNDLRSLLKRLKHELNTTFLHVTHDVTEALALGECIGVMLDGRLRQSGTPTEVFQRPTDPDVAEFLGLSNILEVVSYRNEICQVADQSIHIGQRDEPFKHIWIRPEEMILSRETFSSSARNQFTCTVQDCEVRDVLVAVHVAAGDLKLNVLVTYTSFEELDIKAGAQLSVTFKSSAVHCF